MVDTATSQIKRQPAKVGISFTGAWLAAPKRDWRGIIQASEPLVGVAFILVGNHIEWTKSDRGSAEGLEVTVMLGKYDSLGLDVCVNFFIGNNGPRWRILVEAATFLPKIVAPKEFLTGDLIDFAIVEGRPLIQLKALFLARRDVRVGRNGLWHLRRELVEFFPESLQKILTYGRSGRFDSSK